MRPYSMLLGLRSLYKLPGLRFNRCGIAKVLLAGPIPLIDEGQYLVEFHHMAINHIDNFKLVGM